MNKATFQIGLRGVGIILLTCLFGVAAYASSYEPGLTYGTFTVNGIDLKIDSKSWYNGSTVPSATWALKNLTPSVDKFFNFDDIKPGDFGCEVISMHVKKGDAWLCLNFKNLVSTENGINEPEGHEDASQSGELAEKLQFFGWIDDGDGKYEKEKVLFGTSTKKASQVFASTTYPIGDSKNGGSCKRNETRYAAMCWCAGILTVDMTTGTMQCDGSQLGNIVQTDTMTVDISITASDSKKDSKFLCNPVKPTKPQYCSHGYWKQSQHFDNWVGYSPNTQFSAVFENAFPGKTLLQVLNQGGGGLSRLGRETVGALLNAGKLSNFPYTQAQVIAMFNAAYPGTIGTYSNLSSTFELPHNCPLN